MTVRPCASERMESSGVPVAITSSSWRQRGHGPAVHSISSRSILRPCRESMAVMKKPVGSLNGSPHRSHGTQAAWGPSWLRHHTWSEFPTPVCLLNQRFRCGQLTMSTPLIDTGEAILTFH